MSLALCSGKPPEHSLEDMLDTIIHGDCLEIFPDIPDDSIDLVLTSPPYNLGVDYQVVNDNLPYKEHLAFSKHWLTDTYRVAKPDGRLCLNIPLDTNRNGGHPLYLDLTSLALEVGWHYRTTILWNEQNMSRRTAWGSWCSASAPYVIAPVEVIVVLYKGCWKKQTRGASTITPEEFLAWTNGVWSFPGQKKAQVGGHPAAFPLELPTRCIKLFSYRGDIVLDPFVGSGTTAVACQQLGRHYIGIEINKSYTDFAQQRVARCKQAMAERDASVQIFAEWDEQGHAKAMPTHHHNHHNEGGAIEA